MAIYFLINNSMVKRNEAIGGSSDAQPENVLAIARQRKQGQKEKDVTAVALEESVRDVLKRRGFIHDDNPEQGPF